MRTGASRWLSVLICVLYLCQAVVIPLCAAGDAGAVGRDVGEAVAEPEEEESSLWAWVLGALAVGLGGWIIGDQASDDSAVEDAEKAAEDAAAAAEDAAATAPPAADAQYKVFIHGQFLGTDSVTANAVGLDFSIAEEGDHPGGISRYGDSTALALSWQNSGGRYTQTTRDTVLIEIDDGYYVGIASITSEREIRLQNGTVLRAQGGAKAWIVQLPAE